MTLFKKYELVIVNDIDSPETGMICMVTQDQKEDSKHVKVRYLANRRQHGEFAKSFKHVVQGMIRLSNFGIEISMSDHFMNARVVGESKATYPDGKPRRWQGNLQQVRLAEWFSKDARSNIKNVILTAQLKKESDSSKEAIPEPDPVSAPKAKPDSSKKGHRTYVVRLKGTNPPMYRCDRWIEDETRLSDCHYFHQDLRLAKTY